MIGSLDDTRVRPAPRRAASTPWPAWTPPGALAVATLRRTGCRWPLGEVEEAAFAFCNAPRLRGSYCLDHHRLAYRPSPAR